jgi:hypothetical protein
VATDGIQGLHVEIRNCGASQHWDVVEALLRDPDGRTVGLEASIPAGLSALDGHDQPDEGEG